MAHKNGGRLRCRRTADQTGGKAIPNTDLFVMEKSGVAKIMTGKILGNWEPEKTETEVSADG